MTAAVSRAANSAVETARPGLALPHAIARQLWRGDEVPALSESTIKTGWSSLDAVLPGGGWPTRSVTEVLTTQPATCEWRLVARSLQEPELVARPIVLIGPPRIPCLGGLRHDGLDERRLVWIQADTPVERLWAAEQVVRSAGIGAVLAWLPHVRQEQIRRLQVAAGGQTGLVFLLRPEVARREASAAPLRLSASVRPDWSLEVDVFKRSGPPLDAQLRLESVPGGLRSILTARLRQACTTARHASSLRPSRPHAVGLPAAVERRAASHSA